MGATDNASIVTIGANVFTFNSDTTTLLDFEILYRRNRPARAWAVVQDLGGTKLPALGATFSIKLKGSAFPYWEGVVSQIKVTGTQWRAEGEDILRFLDGYRFNDLMFANLRYTDRLAINKTNDASKPVNYYSNIQIGADVVQYPIVRADYISPNIAMTGNAPFADLVNVSALAHVHFCQQFRAEGAYISGTITFGITLGAPAIPTTGFLRVVVNDPGSPPGTADAQPAMDGTSFLHTKMANGADAISLSTNFVTSGSLKTTFTFTSPIRTIPGELYWLVAERDNVANNNEIEGHGKLSPRAYPYPNSSGVGTHTRSNFTNNYDRNTGFTINAIQIATVKTQITDFDADKTNHRILWGGTSGFQVDLDGSQNATGLSRVIYAHGTEAISGAGKPVDYIITRCGITSKAIVGVDGTYGVLPLNNIDGFAALEEFLIRRFANAAGTRRGRFFASSEVAANTFNARLENFTTDASWKTISNGKDGTGDAILIENNLVKNIRQTATRVLVIGKKAGVGTPVPAIAENLTYISNLGVRLKVEHSDKYREITESQTAAQGIVTEDFSDLYQGSVTISGYWPEFTGYFSSNSFNDIFRLDDGDMAISNLKLRAEEVAIKGGSFTTIVTVSQRPIKTDLLAPLVDLDRRMKDREAINLENTVMLVFRDLDFPVLVGDFWGAFEISGNTVPGIDGGQRRFRFSAAGNGIYVVEIPEDYIGTGSGLQPTATRDITHFRAYDRFVAGTLQHSHAFAADDKPRPSVTQRTFFIANTN